MDKDKEAQSLLRKEKAALSAKLLDAAKAKQPAVQGKIVNDFGQEEAGVPRWQQKQQAMKDMYASCATSADVSHEQRIMKQLEAKKAARAAAAAAGSQRGGGGGNLPAPSLPPQLHHQGERKRDRDGDDEDKGGRKRKSKKSKKHKRRDSASSDSSSSSSSSSSGSDSEEEREHKKKKHKKHKKKASSSRGLGVCVCDAPVH